MAGAGSQFSPCSFDAVFLDGICKPLLAESDGAGVEHAGGVKPADQIPHDTFGIPVFLGSVIRTDIAVKALPGGPVYDIL